MACEHVHAEYGRHLGKIQVGELPQLHLKGKVAWYVYAGPYSELGSKGFPDFWAKFGSTGLKMAGAPGDVYICDPEWHMKNKDEKNMLTLIWCPVA